MLSKGIRTESLNLSFKIKDRERQHVDQLAKKRTIESILKNAHAKVVVQYIPPPNTYEKVELV